MLSNSDDLETKPLSRGHSRATISRNIREMVTSGHSQQQAVAAALDNARRTGRGKKPSYLHKKPKKKS